MRKNYKTLLTYSIVVAAIGTNGLLLFGLLGNTAVNMYDCECGSKTYPECNPDRMPKDYIRDCWNKGPLCPLNAAKYRTGVPLR